MVEFVIRVLQAEFSNKQIFHFWSRPIFVGLLFVLVLFGRRFGRVVFGFVVWFALGVIEEKSIVWFALMSSVSCVQRLKRLKASLSSKTVYSVSSRLSVFVCVRFLF